jgi:hypothetical protein
MFKTDKAEEKEPMGTFRTADGRPVRVHGALGTQLGREHTAFMASWGLWRDHVTIQPALA